MPWLLNAVYSLVLILTLPIWVYKAITTGKYREGLWRKLAGAPPVLNPNSRVLWFHAVSVGEVGLLRPLLERVTSQFPAHQIVLSTSTNSGYKFAKEKYPTIKIFYAPFDFSWAVSRVMEALAPELLVLAELELWPNLLLEAKRRNIPVLVANARMGERSFRGYHRFRWLLARPLSAICWWGAQSEPIARRIEQVCKGIATTIAVTGSMKFDGAPTDRKNPKTKALASLFGFPPGAPVWVAGSTQGDEEQLVLETFAKLKAKHPALRLVIVPRHPERFSAVAELLAKSGWQWRRRSEMPVSTADSQQIILVDTVGELSAVWGLATVGFVGGSFNCNRGGQSMIEPAAYGVATCFGPEVWNFQDVVDRLLEANAACSLSTPDQMLAVLDRWLEEPPLAEAMGQRARQFVSSQLGAVDKTMAALVGILGGSNQRQCA